MDKNSVHCTTPTPTSSSPRCWSVLAWSAATFECGSAPDERDSFPPFALHGFVAETHHTSYGALPRTSPPQLRPSRNESPSAREGLVPTICQIGFVAATHRSSYGALPRTSPPQLRPSRNESPSVREGLVSTIYKIGFVAATHRTSYAALPKTSPPAAKRVPHPGHREQILFTEATCAAHNRRKTAGARRRCIRKTRNRLKCCGVEDYAAKVTQ